MHAVEHLIDADQQQVCPIGLENRQVVAGGERYGFGGTLLGADPVDQVEFARRHGGECK